MNAENSLGEELLLYALGKLHDPRTNEEIAAELAELARKRTVRK